MLGSERLWVGVGSDMVWVGGVEVFGGGGGGVVWWVLGWFELRWLPHVYEGFSGAC